MDIAIKEAQEYVSKGGFESDITIKPPLPQAVTVSLTGWSSKHHISFGTDGTLVNAKNAHICLSEADLVALGYPVRVGGEVVLLNHIVAVKDSSGVEKSYVIQEQFPDETIGLIVCILGDYNGS